MRITDAYYYELFNFLRNIHVQVSYISYGKDLDDSYPIEWKAVGLYVKFNGFEVSYLDNVYTNSDFFNHLKVIKKNFLDEINQNQYFFEDQKSRIEYHKAIHDELRLLDDKIKEEKTKVNNSYKIMYLNQNINVENNSDYKKYKEFADENISEANQTLKSFIREFIIQLDREYKQDFKESRYQNEHSKIPVDGVLNKGIGKDNIAIPIPKLVSFKLVNNDKAHEKLKDVFHELKLFHFITKDSKVSGFYDLFLEKDIKTPLVWNKANGALRYFIRELERREIIHKFNEDKWLIVISAFENKKAGVKYKIKQVSEAKTQDVSNKLIRQLNQILEMF